MTGVNHPRTSWNAISSYKIPLPPIEEQKQIAYILQTVDRKIEVEERRKELLRQLFKTMLHKLMTAQIRLKDV
jgi:type I restriction enzyme S subunit